jgi:parvulin-like peptidyl-prolyl isomerase
MKRFLPFFVLLALVGLLAAGCGGSSSKAKSVPADAVARVGDDTITKTEFNALLAEAKQSFKSQKRAFPKAGSQQYKSLQDQAVQYLIQRSEFDQRGQDLGVNVTDAQVAKRLTQIKKQYFNGNEKKYRAQLKTQGLNEAQVREDIRAQLVSEGIFKKITDPVKVTDADAKAYYTSHKSQYGTPESRDVRHILVNSKKLADSLYSQLKGGANFATLAKKYSKDPGSAAQGGKLTISKGQTVPEFEAMSFKLKTGAIAKPVKTQFGWHIIQALSPVKKATFVPFKKVEAQIKQQLASTKKNDAMTKWVTGVQKGFCKGKVKYAVAYKPAKDPCNTLTSTTSTAVTATAPATTTG